MKHIIAVYPRIATQHLSDTFCVPVEPSVPSLEEWLAEVLQSGNTVGADASCLSYGKFSLCTK